MINPLIVCLAFCTFVSGTVTVREAGKCSASVSHRSDSASLCSAQRQPELLLFHLDHSSLPWMRMLRLTGLFILLLCLVLTGSLSPPAAQVLCSLFLCLADASAWFSALFFSVFFFPPRSFLGFAWSFCLLFLLHGDFLSLSILFRLLLAQEENGDWELVRHSGVGPLFKSGHFSGTVQSVPVRWMQSEEAI